MSNEKHRPVCLTEAPDIELVEQYRSVSAPAIIGLIFGLLSFLALVGPAGWIIPPVAAAVCGIAIWRIRKSAAQMVGQPAAVIGLLLAVLCAAAAVSQWYSYRWIIEHQARGIADSWFALLADDQPLKAHQLTVVPAERKSLDGFLLDAYKHSKQRRESLDDFLGNATVHALLTLGRKADVRFYKCGEISGQSGKENIYEIYSVTFPEDGGRKKTFFVSVLLRRFPPEKAEAINWAVANIRGGIKPPWLPDDEKENPAGGN